MSVQNALLSVLVEKVRTDTLVLPSLPEIAIKIRQLAEDPDVNLHKMADLISHDPALSARIMKIANSAFVGRSIQITTLQQATTRIGLRYIKNVVTAMAMEQLFVSKSALIKKYMDNVWKETKELTALALATMQQYNSNFKYTTVNFDTMTLAGLVHNIGALPVLTEAEKQLEIFGDEQLIKDSIATISAPIGATILRSWGFPADLVEVAEQWKNTEFEPKHPSYTDFIRIAAIRLGLMGTDTDIESQLKPYVDAGLIPSTEYYKSPEFATTLHDVQQMLM
ncbi:MAG TPA: histidine kinase [Rheinheimera sp.]|nr:histidine kinase [Rheinheimera sp.]